MDAPENQTPAAPAADPGPTNAHAEFESLRQAVHWLFALLIVLSGAFGYYLRDQVQFTKSELAGLQPQATNAIAHYETTAEPSMNEFIRRLADYGKTHPDFAPIMTKYGLKEAALKAAPGLTNTLAAPAPLQKK